MSDKMKEIKPFKQVPFCEKDTKLTITGEEFEQIQNLLSAFRNPISAIDSIFQRNLNDGNITIKFIQQDGTEITKEEATDYLKKASEHLKETAESLEK